MTLQVHSRSSTTRCAAVCLQGRHADGRANGARPQREQPKLGDEPLRQRQRRRPGVRQGVGRFHAAHLIGGKLPDGRCKDRPRSQGSPSRALSPSSQSPCGFLRIGAASCSSLYSGREAGRLGRGAAGKFFWRLAGRFRHIPDRRRDAGRTCSSLHVWESQHGGNLRRLWPQQEHRGHRPGQGPHALGLSAAAVALLVRRRKTPAPSSATRCCRRRRGRRANPILVYAIAIGWAPSSGRSSPSPSPTACRR